MKIYHLVRTATRPEYDAFNELVIIAGSPAEARTLANANHGDEGQIWGSPKGATCKQLLPTGKARIVCADFNAG